MKKVFIVLLLLALVLASSCTEPVPENSDNSETPENSVNTCVIDLVNNTETCSGISPQVVQLLEPCGDGKAVVKIDMTNYSVLEMRIKIAAEELGGQWLLNIGNSPSNNGGGGDSHDFSNDSELYVSSEYDENFMLELTANDYFTPAGAVVANLVDLFPPTMNGKTPCTWTLRVKIADQKMCATVENTGALRDASSEYIFRLGGPDEEADGNDFIYYAAFNRVIGDAARTGSGVCEVTFQWRNTWDGCTCNTGPGGGWTAYVGDPGRYEPAPYK